ncbi:hypothetical protein HMPREF9554_01503, partial [Treponema phagedenis F0421]
RNDVLKQNYLQGFKTPDLVFFTGRQNSALPRMAVVPRSSDVLKQVWFQTETMF